MVHWFDNAYRQSLAGITADQLAVFISSEIHFMHYC